MSFLLEYRKINDINIPLYFKFSPVPTKDNLTTDKLMTLENWMNVFDQLNPLLVSEPVDPKARKTFDMDSGRLSVKARWVKISDTSDMGSYIVKILNLSSSSVGKYFLKIDVKLSSYLERIALEWEQKNKSLDGKPKAKESSHDSSKSHDLRSSSKLKKNNHRKISDMLPIIKKENNDSPLLFNDTADDCALDQSIAELSKVEEYIPLPAPSASSSFLAEPATPKYIPEKSCPQNDIISIHSEYSPVPLKAGKSSDETAKYEPTAVTPPLAATYYPEKKLSQIEMNKIKSDYSEDEVSYKPTTRGSRSSNNDKTKKALNRSKELFGSSDENCDDDRETPEQVSSSSHRSKRRLESSPRRDKKSIKDKTKSKKKRYHDIQSSQDSSSSSDITIRNLMKEPIKSILATYPDHETYLTGLYDDHVKQLKRNYKPGDIPDMAALDIVSTPQFTAMIDFLEKKLVRDAEEEHNYSDIIFDLLIPEWSLAIFCKKFRCSRFDALERLRLQSVALSNSSQL